MIYKFFRVEKIEIKINIYIAYWQYKNFAAKLAKSGNFPIMG